jgi:hypothetical protein
MRIATSNSTVQKRKDGPPLVAPAMSSGRVDSPRSAYIPRQDILHLAYDRFVYDFVASEDPNRPPDEPSDALFSFVPLLYQHAEPGSCLTTIVNAVAYINYANRCNSAHAAILAEESFGEGIRLLAGVLTDTEKAASNDTLCSVHLMGIFEVR